MKKAGEGEAAETINGFAADERRQGKYWENIVLKTKENKSVKLVGTPEITTSVIDKMEKTFKKEVRFYINAIQSDHAGTEAEFISEIVLAIADNITNKELKDDLVNYSTRLNNEYK